MSVTREQRARLEALIDAALRDRRSDAIAFGRFADRLAAILDAPAPEGTVEVEHSVSVDSDGEVSTRGLNAYGQVVLREPDSDQDRVRSHTVRVRYRVPLPPEPVTVEGEVVR